MGLLSDQISFGLIGGTDQYVSPINSISNFSSATKDYMRTDLNLPQYKSSRLNRINNENYKHPENKTLPNTADEYKAPSYNRYPSSLRQSGIRESMENKYELKDESIMMVLIFLIFIAFIFIYISQQKILKKIKKLKNIIKKKE